MTSEDSKPESPVVTQPDATNGPSPLRFTTGLAALGLGLSLLLEYVHVSTYLNPAADSFCSVGKSFDCAAVAASSSSIFLGMPWAVWGSIGFLMMLVAAVQRSRWLLPLSLISAGVSLALLVVSLVQVGSLCYLCEATHVVSWLLAYFTVQGRAQLKGSLTSTLAVGSILSPGAALSLAALLFTPHYWGSFSYKADLPLPHGVTEEGFHWIGAESPSKTIHEFVDYTCPHCKLSSARTLRELSEHDDWRLVRRHQPRMRCKKGIASPCLSLRMVLCAEAQDKYWQADRWLFAHAEARQEFDPSLMAQELGFPETDFLACVENDNTYERANTLAKDARKITSVPTYLVDGKKLKPAEVAELFK